MSDSIILYRVAEGGPFDLQVDNGVTIENITDDLVNAKILIPDTCMQDIADAWNAYREDGGSRYSEAMDNFVGVVMGIVEDNNG